VPVRRDPHGAGEPLRRSALPGRSGRARPTDGGSGLAGVESEPRGQGAGAAEKAVSRKITVSLSYTAMTRLVDAKSLLERSM
jgi:hypothetical protein